MQLTTHFYKFLIIGWHILLGSSKLCHLLWQFLSFCLDQHWAGRAYIFVTSNRWGSRRCTDIYATWRTRSPSGSLSIIILKTLSDELQLWCQLNTLTRMMSISNGTTLSFISSFFRGFFDNSFFLGRGGEFYEVPHDFFLATISSTHSFHLSCWKNSPWASFCVIVIEARLSITVASPPPLPLPSRSVPTTWRTLVAVHCSCYAVCFTTPRSSSSDNFSNPIYNKSFGSRVFTCFCCASY